MKSTKKSVIAIVMAMFMVFSLAATALGAVVIDFDNIDIGSTDYTVDDVNFIISASGDVTVTGDGTIWGLKLTDDTVLIVDGYTIIGLGVYADGDLTITAGADGGELYINNLKDPSLHTSGSPHALEVNGDLTIDGGVYVWAEVGAGYNAHAVTAQVIEIIDGALYGVVQGDETNESEAIKFHNFLTIHEKKYYADDPTAFKNEYPENFNSEGGYAYIDLSTLEEPEEAISSGGGGSVTGMSFYDVLQQLYKTAGSPDVKKLPHIAGVDSHYQYAVRWMNSISNSFGFLIEEYADNLDVFLKSDISWNNFLPVCNEFLTEMYVNNAITAEERNGLIISLVRAAAKNLIEKVSSDDSDKLLSEIASLVKLP